MSSRKTITRREFLQVTGVAVAAATLTACAPAATPTAAPKLAEPTKAPAATTAPAATQPPAPTAAPASKYKEAPALAEQVKAGKLPAVDSRLPANPLVLKPLEKVGKYGGTWRTALRGGQDDAWLTRLIGYDYLVRFDPAWTTVIPCVAESYTASPDAKEYTFKLRKGMKWSDGKPFTADDIVFYFQDILNNKELTPAVGGSFAAGGKYATATKVDETTVTIKFESPNGLFIIRNATPDGQSPVQFQAAYCKQFHKAYTDQAKLDQAIKDNKVDGDWVKLFQTMCSSVPGTPINGRWMNVNLPVISAWSLTTPSGTNAPVKTARNPYYWKVDTAGNQLPYIDSIFFDLATDIQALALKAAAGEIDMMDRHIATNQNKPVFVDNMKKGDYWLFETIPSSMNNMIISFNLTCKDEKKRKVFQDINFRIGVSHAINRKELIDVVWVGQGEPYQCGPRPTSPFYNEKLAKQYTEYDVAKANEYLDKAGLKKGADGMRTMPDGSPLSIAWEISNTRTDTVAAAPIVQKYLKAVGIDMQPKVMDRALMYTHKDANEFEAMDWGGDGGLDVILEPRWYFPFSGESQFAEGWQYWYNKSPLGKDWEPPEAPKKQMELYDQLKATGDTKKQDELMKEILKIAQEQFYAIGIALPANGYGICKNNFKNVPKSMPGAWLYPNPGPTDPPQYFFDV
ncbi:MAG TPA: ABC transporter substrate-binding protein [Anaerolineaceae bacterium]